MLKLSVKGTSWKHKGFTWASRASGFFVSYVPDGLRYQLCGCRVHWGFDLRHGALLGLSRLVSFNVWGANKGDGFGMCVPLRNSEPRSQSGCVALLPKGYAPAWQTLKPESLNTKPQKPPKTLKTLNPYGSHGSIWTSFPSGAMKVTAKKQSMKVI